MSVTVFRDKFGRSWPTLDADNPWRECDRGRVMDLSEALERDYGTDAHFAAYVSPNGERLNTTSLAELAPRGGITITTGVFDGDAPTHGTNEPVPESWRREQREKIVALEQEFRDIFFYETRGGFRFLARLEEPTVLFTAEDAAQWSREYLVVIEFFKRKYGIEADGSCKDWQRLYRLPHATRTPGGKPERWCTWGDTNRIGTLLVHPTHDDVAAARSKSTAFRERPPQRQHSNVSGGDGLFYHLLRNRGHLFGNAARGGWIALCPNRSQHSKNTDKTDTTVVVPPSDGGEIGLILCKHGHCDERFTVAQWLRFFSDSELADARRAAGITRAA